MMQVAPLQSPAGQLRSVPDTVRWVIAPVQLHWRAFLSLNLLYFGVFAVAAVYAFINPAAQTELTALAGDAFSPTGRLGPLVRAYLEGNLLAAILLTFAVNLVGATMLALTLPSALIPFAGILIGVYRAILWGVLFSPTGTSTLGPALWPHVPTILVEGEAYVVAMLGVWLWWQPVFARAGQRWRAWRMGLVLQLRVYTVVAALLALAATYEAIEVIWLLRQIPAA